MIAPTNYLPSYVTIVYDARTIVTSFFYNASCAVTMPSVVSIIKKEDVQTRTISLSICRGREDLSLSLFFEGFTKKNSDKIGCNEG